MLYIPACAPEDHVGTPAPYEKCCTYNESDCMKSYSGSWDAFRGCIGKVSCTGVPVIRDEPICSQGGFPRFSNHMILEYYCMPRNHFLSMRHYLNVHKIMRNKFTKYYTEK
jgi:hypothetical protein